MYTAGLVFPSHDIRRLPLLLWCINTAIVIRIRRFRGSAEGVQRAGGRLPVGGGHASKMQHDG
jgi:hypothetical protein